MAEPVGGIVPDKLLREDQSSAALLAELDKEENVFILPDRYILKGVWGGASLAFKGIIGQLWAAIKVPSMTHAVLISGDSVPMAPMAALRATSCSDISLVLQFKVPKHEVEKRLGSVTWECNGMNAVANIRRTVPKLLKDTFRKGSQWNVMASKDLWDLFTPNGTKRHIIDDQLPTFGSMLIADEHFLPTIFTILVRSDGYDHLDEATNHLAVHTSWMQGGAHPDYLSPAQVVAAAKEHPRRWFARKIETLEVFEASLRAVNAISDSERKGLSVFAHIRRGSPDRGIGEKSFQFSSVQFS
eukprot:CAMPEP_0202088396 /NCGR_PEP_ID=MMETSP0964-20121228/38490_1 /ASSEMBLY_ACC=CAM_ASM_000500 /TAXON_ID=4773 /ORGANISM="Schizochytrium aggregatum, Strain ATCC28209" /LENGTH=299 /DNA_ID=CAMNT_0048656413 /DNA_START=29 /DNA_END=927 /DNA_ORIENTATION=+